MGVAITSALEQHDFIRPAQDKQFIVTVLGEEWFFSIGIDIKLIQKNSSGLARQCLDWTERFHHIGGLLGAQLMVRLSELGWLKYSRETRAVEITPKGIAELKQKLDVDINAMKFD